MYVGCVRGVARPGYRSCLSVLSIKPSLSSLEASRRAMALVDKNDSGARLLG